MHLEIITPDKIIYEGEVEYVQLPGSEGSFGILKNHAPIIASLGKGELNFTESNNQKQTLMINGGVVEVLNNKISVLAEQIL